MTEDVSQLALHQLIIHRPLKNALQESRQLQPLRLGEGETLTSFYHEPKQPGQE